MYASALWWEIKQEQPTERLKKAWTINKTNAYTYLKVVTISLRSPLTSGIEIFIGSRISDNLGKLILKKKYIYQTTSDSNDTYTLSSLLMTMCCLIRICCLESTSGITAFTVGFLSFMPPWNQKNVIKNISRQKHSKIWLPSIQT